MRYGAIMANIGQAGAGLAWIAFTLITMGGCATYEPVSLDEVPFRDRAVTQVDNDVRVSAVVLSEDETELIFAADLYARGIQPIWLEIENNEEFTVRFLAIGLDPEYFAPLEASYISRFRWAKYANEQKDEHYLSMALGEHIQAGTTRSGFVFSHLEHGTRVFNVDIIGKDHDLRTFSFTTQVPGLETDYREIDWANLYPSDQIVDHDLDSLRAALLGLPCCVTSTDGSGQGHPLNIVFVGSFQDILYALVRSGWDETGVTTRPRGKSKPIPGVDERYRPVSIRYVYGRRQDASFRKSRHGINPPHAPEIVDEPNDVGGCSGMGGAGRPRFRNRTEVLDPRDGRRRCAELPDARRDVCAASGKMGVRPAARWRSKSGVAEFLYRHSALC